VSRAPTPRNIGAIAEYVAHPHVRELYFYRVSGDQIKEFKRTEEDGLLKEMAQKLETVLES
jgi:hypothetical protein